MYRITQRITQLLYNPPSTLGSESTDAARYPQISTSVFNSSCCIRTIHAPLDSSIGHHGEPGKLPILVPHRLGGWLPKNHRVLEAWITKKIDEVSKNKLPLLPVMVDFKNLIEGDPVIYMGFHQMFDQIPTKPPHNQQPDGKPQVRAWSLISPVFFLNSGADSRLSPHAGIIQQVYPRSAFLGGR